jgi:hypothetical protein
MSGLQELLAAKQQLLLSNAVITPRHTFQEGSQQGVQRVDVSTNHVDLSDLNAILQLMRTTIEGRATGGGDVLRKLHKMVGKQDNITAGDLRAVMKSKFGLAMDEGAALNLFQKFWSVSDAYNLRGFDDRSTTHLRLQDISETLFPHHFGGIHGSSRMPAHADGAEEEQQQQQQQQQARHVQPRRKHHGQKQDGGSSSTAGLMDPGTTVPEIVQQLQRKITQHSSSDSDQTRKIFKLFSSKATGIRLPAFSDALDRQFGIRLAPARTRELFEFFDRNGNGEIDVQEFCRALRPLDYEESGHGDWHVRSNAQRDAKDETERRRRKGSLELAGGVLGGSGQHHSAIPAGVGGADDRELVGGVDSPGSASSALTARGKQELLARAQQHRQKCSSRRGEESTESARRPSALLLPAVQQALRAAHAEGAGSARSRAPSSSSARVRTTRSQRQEGQSQGQTSLPSLQRLPAGGLATGGGAGVDDANKEQALRGKLRRLRKQVTQRASMRDLQSGRSNCSFGSVGRDTERLHARLASLGSREREDIRRRKARIFMAK